MKIDSLCITQLCLFKQIFKKILLNKKMTFQNSKPILIAILWMQENYACIFKLTILLSEDCYICYAASFCFEINEKDIYLFDNLKWRNHIFY